MPINTNNIRRYGVRIGSRPIVSRTQQDHWSHIHTRTHTRTLSRSHTCTYAETRARAHTVCEWLLHSSQWHSTGCVISAATTSALFRPPPSSLTPFTVQIPTSTPERPREQKCAHAREKLSLQPFWSFTHETRSTRSFFWARPFPPPCCRESEVGLISLSELQLSPASWFLRVVEKKTLGIQHFLRA